MKFAIYIPERDAYWEDDGAMDRNWKKAKIFLTREDAESYVTWIINEYAKKTLGGYDDLTYIVRQVK